MGIALQQPFKSADAKTLYKKLKINSGMSFGARNTHYVTPEEMNARMNELRYYRFAK